MTDLKTERNNWILGLAGLFVGTIGAFIESWDLSGDLNHRYPFKIMNTPPPPYYIEVANTISSLAPFLAVIGGIAFLVLLKKFKVMAGFVPIIISPMTYIFGLWYITANGPYKDELHNPVNFDRASAAMRHEEFYFGAI